MFYITLHRSVLISSELCNYGMLVLLLRGAPIIGQFADDRYRPFDNQHQPIIGIGQ